MNKPLLIVYNVVLVLVAAGALWWYSTTKGGPPELTDGTKLVPFTGQWPADWPLELRVVTAEGVWADKLSSITPDGPTREYVSGQFFFPQPLEEVERDLGLLLRDSFGHVTTVNLTQEGGPLQGYFMSVPNKDQVRLGFINATVLASPAAPKLRRNPGDELDTVVTIRRLRMKAGATGSATPAAAPSVAR